MFEDKNTLSKIRRVLKFVWENPYSGFYREKYKRAGIKDIREIRTWEDFYALPFLTREEIVQTSPYERFFLPPHKAYRMAVTSGTTGLPLILLHGEGHPLQFNFIMRKRDRLKIKATLFLFGPLQGQSRILQIPPPKEKQRFCLNFLGDISNLALSAKVAAGLGIDGLYTTTTILTFFIPYLQKEYNLGNIRYILLDGEPCSEQKVHFLKRIFPNAYFDFDYGGNESGVRGLRCESLVDLPPRFYHPTPVFYCEILNPKQESELVLTHLTTQAGFPLIRYKTGDTVKLEAYNCRCGFRGKMEVFGKLAYDVATVQGAFIYADHVERALAPFAPYLETQDWQIHIFEEAMDGSIKTRLKLQVVPKKTLPKTELGEIQKLITQSLSQVQISARLTLSELVEKGVFLPLVVEFVSSFPKTQKQKHFISHIR